MKSEKLQQRLLAAISEIPAVDTHTHILPRLPFARNLGELLGSNCLTELAFSAGLEQEALAEGEPGPKAVEKLVGAMSAFDNTVQYGWVMDMARDLFDFPHAKLSENNWRELAGAVESEAAEPARGREIMQKAAVEKAFVVSSFWDDLSEMDQVVFSPVLNANDLVFGLAKPEVRKSLKKNSKLSVSDSTALRDAVDEVLKRFQQHGCAGVCLELPPHFKVFPVVENDFDTAIEKSNSKKPLSAGETANLHCGILFAVAELCNAYGMPVMLMSGAATGVYRHGVPYARDLPVADATLRSLLPLFNNFPKLNWCVSVLSGSQAQELSTYGWIIQNVVISGDWRYHSVPEYIERNLAARIQSVPKTKLIGYYSDTSKLELEYAKYKMYRRILAGVLADDFVSGGRGSEEDAVSLARYLLRDNAYRIFGLS